MFTDVIALKKHMLASFSIEQKLFRQISIYNMATLAFTNLNSVTTGRNVPVRSSVTHVYICFTSVKAHN